MAGKQRASWEADVRSIRPFKEYFIDIADDQKTRAPILRYLYLLFAISMAMILYPTYSMAACKLAMSDDAYTEFLNDPQHMLRRFPEGGRDLAFQVRNFAPKGVAALRAIAQVARAASIPQKKAIGEGLAIATVACLARDTEISREIVSELQYIDDRDVTQSFVAFTEDDASASDDTPKLEN